MSGKDINYVQLEARAFLSDLDFQTMTLEERGAYCTVILYLYVNGGQIRNNGCAIAMLCNCRIPAKSKFSVWEKIKHKFKVKSGMISHKRVSDELKKCEIYRESKRKAGIEGARKRWQGDNIPIAHPSHNQNTPIPKSNTKANIKKKKLELTMQYDEKLNKLYEPLTPKEKTTFRNIRLFLMTLDLENIEQAISWLGEVKQWGDDNDKTNIEVKKCYVSKIKKLGWKSNGK